MTTEQSGDAESIIDLSCTTHTYPDGTVGMHDADFSAYPEEIVAVIGSNGAGKSTLLEHLNATLLPDEGRLVVDGVSITEETKAHARNEVGFVFQDADTQLVAPTVLDDVLFGLQNRGVPDAEATQRARDALSTVDAAHLEDRVPHYLSGGEKRLVGLAGVLVTDPAVVVLDEPFAGLDPERSQLVADRLTEIHDDGISIVLSTHDIEAAAELADRVCVVADGDVIADGTPRAVFYDDALLAEAGLRPPTPVRIARQTGIDATAQPVTEAELVSHITEAGSATSTDTGPAVTASGSDSG
jgi:ABC-type cobalt transport system, ATPase component